MPIVEHRYRRNTKVQWTELNPVLGPGEPGMEIDTKKFKLGDGVTAWNNLLYFVPVGANPQTSDAAMLAHIMSDEPHPVYDDGPSLALLYENAKV